MGQFRGSTAIAGDALPRRAAPTTAYYTTAVPDPRSRLQWVAHPALNLPDPSPGQIDPRSAGLGVSGEPSAAGTPSPASPAARPFILSRPIENLRPRLDPTLTKSWPFDPDLAVVIRAYRFGRVLLLKSPPGSEYSTRSPI